MSPRRGPTICRPTGRPCDVIPQGSEIALLGEVERIHEPGPGPGDESAGNDWGRTASALNVVIGRVSVGYRR